MATDHRWSGGIWPAPRRAVWRTLGSGTLPDTRGMRSAATIRLQERFVSKVRAMIAVGRHHVPASQSADVTPLMPCLERRSGWPTRPLENPPHTKSGDDLGGDDG